jgi:hypothetical protein
MAGRDSHLLEFSYPGGGSLFVYSGMDDIEWGYTLNVARYPTYTGEVVQILSCYVDDVTVHGSVQSHKDMEEIYEFFLGYISEASQGRSGEAHYIQDPITFNYPHRGWSFKIVPMALPAYRYGRDVVVPEWRVQAFVLDRDSSEELSDLIREEADIKDAIGSTETDVDTNFSIKGEIKFVDENPFSDPWTDHGTNFDTERKKRFDQLADYYTSLLPSYLKGDFDALSGGSGSKPALSKGGLYTNSADPDQDKKGSGTAAEKKAVNRSSKAPKNK